MYEEFEFSIEVLNVDLENQRNEVNELRETENKITDDVAILEAAIMNPVINTLAEVISCTGTLIYLSWSGWSTI